MRNEKNTLLPLNIMENFPKDLKHAPSGYMEIHPGLCPTGHRPFGAAAQKGENVKDNRYDDGRDSSKWKGKKVWNWSQKMARTLKRQRHGMKMV